MRLTTYQTVSVATNELAKKGFDAEFKFDDGRLQHTETRKHYRTEDLKILEFHRFEGDSDPADNSIVYAVECKDGTKGIIVAAYGPYGSVKLDGFMKQVEVADKTEAAGPIRQPTQH